MELISTEINQGEILEVGLEFELALSSGFEAECISGQEGIKPLNLINLKGRIISIENKAIYIKEEGTPFIYRITLENFLLTCLQSKNELLLERATNSAAIYNNRPREIDYSKSKAYERTLEISKSFAAIPQSKEDYLDGVPIKYKPRDFTMMYAPSVYKQLYAGNIEELDGVRQIFEDALPQIISSLFGTDNVFGVLETYPQVLSTIDQELKQDYDLDTLLALEFLRVLTIELKQYLSPQEENFTLEENKRISILLPYDVRAKFLDNGESYAENVSTIDGIIINSSEEHIIISTRDGLIEVNKYELECVRNAKLKNEIVKIFSKHMERLTPSLFFDLLTHYLNDNIGVISNDELTILLYLEKLIKTDRISEGVSFVIHLSTLK